MYSITSRNSFEEISQFHQQILRVKDKDFFPTLVVANKADLEYERQVGVHGQSQSRTPVSVTREREGEGNRRRERRGLMSTTARPWGISRASPSGVWTLHRAESDRVGGAAEARAARLGRSGGVR